MLVLTRKEQEAIMIGETIIVRILEVNGDQVRIGIEAPQHIAVHREEVFEAIANERIEAEGNS